MSLVGQTRGIAVLTIKLYDIMYNESGAMPSSHTKGAPERHNALRFCGEAWRGRRHPKPIRRGGRALQASTAASACYAASTPPPGLVLSASGAIDCSPVSRN